MNVAVNLRKQGINSSIISRIGNDELGAELNDFLKISKVSSIIQIDKLHNTGVVNVKLGTNKEVSYDIIFPSAWDFIEMNVETDKVVSEADYVVFGSLACRNHTSRSTLFKILEKAKRKVFDVNLRFPHYEKELIEKLLLKADIVKVNEDELRILNDWFIHSADAIGVVSKEIREKYKIDQLIITLGEKGAMVSYGNEVINHDGFKVEVEDTVGSGDAFLAAFLAHQIKGRSIQESLKFACATGTYVVTQQGANPQYDESQIVKFINSQHFEGMVTKLTL